MRGWIAVAATVAVLGAAGCAAPPLLPGSEEAHARLVSEHPWAEDVRAALERNDPDRALALLAPAVEHGDALAGECKRILAGEPDESDASRELRQEIAPQAVSALLDLGVSEPADLPAAAAWLQAEGAAGQPAAHYQLALFHLFGIGGLGDAEAGFELARRASGGGLAQASWLLGVLHVWGIGTPPDLAAARDAWLRGAVAGHVPSMRALAVSFGVGPPSRRDPEQAKYWYREAAEAGDPEAQLHVGLGLLADSPDEAATWLERAAEQGNARAMEELGSLLVAGKGRPRDYDAALQWLREAAELGEAGAMSELGVMYANGFGVPEDQGAAVDWYRRGAEGGSAHGQFNLGVRYDRGNGVEKNQRLAASWYERAAAQGHAKARHNLAALKWKGIDGEKDTERALALWNGLAGEGHVDAMKALARTALETGDDAAAARWQRSAAEAGDAASQALYGNHAAAGKGVPQSLAVAEEWWTKAADQGNAEGRFRLGTYWISKRPAPDSLERGTELLRLAAEQGHAAAQYRFGLLLQKDRPEQAHRWFTKAGEQGEPRAMASLGDDYTFGRGTARNPRLGAKWYARSHEAGELRGTYALGGAYVMGWGVALDPARAFELFEQAAARGYPLAHSALGDAYKVGRGVRKDDAKAMEHWRIAADAGVAQAQHNVGWHLLTEAKSPVERQKGIELLQEAADQDHPKALMALGGIYAAGVVVPRDLMRARAYGVRARRLGAPRAGELLGHVERLERESKRANAAGSPTP